MRKSLTTDERITKGAHEINLLEIVASKLGNPNSPAIHAATSQIVRNLPSSGNHYLYNEAHQAIGHGAPGSFTYDPRYGAAEAVRVRCNQLCERMVGEFSLGDDDPAFEILRHLSNNWYGRRPNASHSNKMADELLQRYPHPLGAVEILPD